MFTKKAFLGFAAAAAIAGLVWTTANAGGGISPNPKHRQLDTAGEGQPFVSAACPNPAGPCCHPCLYFEDFENAGHFPPGTPINGKGNPADVYDVWTTGCLGTIVASQVSIGNPAGGAQHLRLVYDPALPTDADGSVNGGCIVAARVPVNAIAAGNNPPISNPTLVECDVAISAAFGSDFWVQPQGRGDTGRFSPRTLFFYYGTLYVLDEETFVGMGNWDTTGAYQHWSMSIDPCANTITYDYGNGMATHTDVDTTTGSGMVRFIDQFLVYHDNFANTENYDVDNVSISRNPTPCPAVCGDGTLTVPEQCDGALDTACPGRCQADCTCAIVCGGPTLPGNPCTACDIVNDVAYTNISTGGWFKFVASAPAYAFDTCGITIPEGGAYDSALSVWSGDCATGLTLIKSNDDCSGLAPYDLDSDPLASCYQAAADDAPYPACLCVGGLNLGETYYVSDDRADNSIGRRIDILASKRASCGAIWGDRGACCDTNGADAGCTDDVAAVDCAGADKVYTKNKSCGSAEAGPCDCIPVCAGLACGDDGCGGSCGTCNDNVACTVDTCNAGACVYTPNNAACDDGLVCNGGENCSLQGCKAGTPLNCGADGLFCNGTEGCAEPNGCFAGTPPCNPSTEICDEATDTCAPAAIPTVSEWGLAIMSLLLLVGLKVYFGRREALA